MNTFMCYREAVFMTGKAIVTKESPVKTFHPGILRGIARFFVICLLIMASTLFALSFSFTGIFPTLLEDYVLSERMSFVSIFLQSGLVAMLPTIIFACLELLLLFLVWRYVTISSRVLAIITCALLVIVQLIWVGMLNASDYLYPDSRYMVAGAEALSRGDYSVFNMPGIVHDNLIWYPYQAGGMFLFALFWNPGITNPYLVFQAVSAICNTGTAALLIWQGYLLSEDHRVVRVLCILVLTCSPLILSSSFIYANAQSLFFSTLACSLLIYLMRKNPRYRVLLVLTCCLSMLLSLWMKSTNQIVLIPLALVTFLVVLDRKRVREIVTTLCLVAALLVGMRVPLHVLERLAATDFGEGMPTISWIAMGMDVDSDSDVLFGWWTPKQLQIFDGVNQDTEVHKELAKEQIEQEFSYFVSHPSEAAHLFMVKLASEWTDPTFQSVYYTSLSQPVSSHWQKSIIQLSSSFENPFMWHVDAHQLLVYAGLVIYSWRLLRKKDILHAELVIPVILLAGAFVYIFWEAKSVYLFPYFVWMLPLSAIGISAVFSKISHLREASKFRRGKHVKL
ncbi:MAG: hypothetical protein ACOX4F_02960 [Atopobiaceae bacterium]|jgi:hypothetical protein